MYWHSANDTLPEHEQEVLICCAGQYNVAVYLHDRQGFRLRGGAVFKASDWAIEWVKLRTP